jgi:hypothetical protein
MKMTDFWDDVPCNLLENGRRLEDAYCPQGDRSLPEDHIFTGVRSSNALTQ